VGELRRLQLPEEENRKLKQLVADPEPRQTHPAGRAVQKCPDACNTVNGAGKAVKSAGSAISSASGENKK
jgi:hypothetical protein